MVDQRQSGFSAHKADVDIAVRCSSSSTSALSTMLARLVQRWSLVMAQLAPLDKRADHAARTGW